MRKLLPVVLLGVVLSAPAAAAGPGARVIAGVGCTRESPEGACKEIAPGSPLSMQVTLVAGKGGATVELADRSTVRLVEGSQMRLFPRTKLQLGKGDTPAEVIQLQRGKVFAELASSRGALLIKSSQQTAAVVKKGSAVVKSGDDAFVLAMLKGSGVVGSGSEFNDVLEGKVRVLRKGDPKGTTRDLLGAPEGRLAANMVMRIGASTEGARFTWKPLAGAESYEVELRPSKGVPSQFKAAKGVTEQALEGLEAGGYEVAVRGIDAEDFESPWSVASKLNIIGVELPVGASAQGDTVQLPEKAKVKLRAVDTLEASFDQLTTFVPAPGEVGLSSGRGQTLRLRRRGEESELRLRLVPRSYFAQVDLSPKNARWPGDAVQVEIQLVSGNGLAPPSDIELKPVVTLDQEQLSPTWTRDGGRMRATIPPRDDKKPHVVRVEVSDQNGFALGRNFLEIAAR